MPGGFGGSAPKIFAPFWGLRARRQVTGFFLRRRNPSKMLLLRWFPGLSVPKKARDSSCGVPSKPHQAPSTTGTTVIGSPCTIGNVMSIAGLIFALGARCNRYFCSNMVTTVFTSRYAISIPLEK
eukprot:TRINITY_DN66498_c4_g1_i2.p1 TRINITY_DN66498_c4_g1~~TRINITY_DN66498_c4_g1_i2.p1  ORF type:complete len:133 (-),score=2.09 TRINITY_DN66498_c4_g1_i2:357-731(-)